MKWVILKFPAIATKNDELGRVEGEPLWAERVSLEDLKSTEELLGTKHFSALYQQEPIENEESHFKIDNFQYFNNSENEIINELYVEDNMLFMTIDPASSKNEWSDYTAMAVCGKNTNDDLFIYHIFRKRISPGEYETEIINLAERYNIRDIYIEDIGFQKLILKDLERSKYNINGLKATESKSDRSYNFKRLLYMKKVYLKANSNWIDDLIRELQSFPNGRHDDQVEVLSYAAKIELEYNGMNILGTKYNSEQNNIKPRNSNLKSINYNN